MKHCLHTPLIPAARARCASLAFALALVAGAAHAQTPGSMPPPPGLQAEPAAAAPPAPGLPLQRSRSTLKQLGLDYEVTLRGIQGTAGIPFSIRSDQVVDHAALHLKYTYSPALLPDLSHLRVTVNDVTVATLPVSVEEAGRPVERDVAIDPRLVTDYNRVNLQLIGHYTRECEDPDHTSLWANIDSASYLELGWLPLPLSNDLALLPVPFFDSRDTRRLELPFVFAGQPANGQLQAAGIVSSWFGALAGYRGAMFPVSTGALPARGNAVVVATPRNLPAGLALPEVAGPTLAVLSNPNDAGGKLLLVLGRDDAELRAAATALALGAPLSGASATLRDVKEAAPRKPYDAPNWVPSDRPVRFSELVRSTSELNVVGYNPDLIRIGLQLPPDLFVWRKDGIPVDLRYRYTLPEGADKSALNISINDAFVTTLPLNGRPLATSVPRQMWQKLGARGAMPIQQPLLLPTGPLSASSQLRFHFFFDRPRAEECKNTFPDVSASIDDSSTIDLSGFAHYMAMPNLAAFGNAGFPFTRLADLSGSALVMPDNANGDDVANALALLGRMGASTGYPALRTRFIQARQVDEHADQDLLVLGSRRSQPLFARWAAAMPVGDGAQVRRFGLSDWLFNKMPAFLSADARRTDLPTVAEVGVRPEPGDVLLMGFESPLRKGRSVVALMADEPGHVSRLFEAWFDPERLRGFQGSVVLLHGEKVRSLAGNQTYYVGELPPLLALRWFFAHHPLWMALGVGLVCLLLAMLAGWLLRRHARARLKVAG